MIIKPTRRGIITGIASLFAAPPIVRAASLMQVRGEVMPIAKSVTPKPREFFDVSGDDVEVYTDEFGRVRFRNSDGTEYGA